jgi:hypothetical protein
MAWDDYGDGKGAKKMIDPLVLSAGAGAAAAAAARASGNTTPEPGTSAGAVAVAGHVAREDLVTPTPTRASNFNAAFTTTSGQYDTAFDPVLHTIPRNKGPKPAYKDLLYPAARTFIPLAIDKDSEEDEDEIQSRSGYSDI